MGTEFTDDGVEFGNIRRRPRRSASIILSSAATEHSPSNPSSPAGTSASGSPAIAASVVAGLDDYTEVFADFLGSSDIPYFDLPPALDGFGTAPVRPRGSGLDYSEVFCGVDESAAASSCEELFAAPGWEEISSWNASKRNMETANCSHQAMEELKLSPTHCQGSHIASEEGDRLSLNSNSSDNVFAQFSVSYSKANQAEKEVGISTETHVTRLHAVPALSFMAGTDPPSQTTESDGPNNLSSDGIGNRKHENESPARYSSSSQSSEKYQRAYQDHTANEYPSKKDNVNASHPAHSSSTSMFSGDGSSCDINYTTASISLQTQPLTVPPALRPPSRLSDKQGHPNLRIFSITNPDEVDFSSAAAASVAAVEEAMEFARAKLKIAKELLERKHDNLQKSKQWGYQKSIRDKERKLSQSSPEQERFGAVLVSPGKRSEVTTSAKLYKEKGEDVVRNEGEGQARQDNAKV